MPEDILIKKLRCVKEDGNWRRKSNEIKTRMDQYEKKHSDTSAAQIGVIVEECLNPILPTYWEVFHTHNIYQRRKSFLPCQGNNADRLPCYDVGIFLVGFSSLPIALGLAEIQPLEQIYFLHSSDTDLQLY